MDDDIIYFYFEIHFTEPEQLNVKFFEDLSTVVRWTYDTHRDFYDYYTKTHSSLDLWGPAEPQTLEAIGEEAVKQLYVYLDEYMQSRPWIDKVFEQEKNLSRMSTGEQVKHQQQAAQVFNKLSEGVGDMKRATHRDRKFCQTAQQKLRETAFEVYPEIANLEPEQLKEFKHFFTNEILSMSRRLEKMVYEQRRGKK